MAPLSRTPQVDLTGKSILIVSGQWDSIIQPERAAQLVTRLRQRGATVEHRTLPIGHELSQAEITTHKRGYTRTSIRQPPDGQGQREIK